jgi:hypothetical protein
LKDLLDIIRKNTVGDSKEIEKSITSMVCSKNDLIQLSEESLVKALSIDGEFLVLKLHYDDFEDELKNQVIKYKISQSLSVITCYEDDTNSYEKIAEFVDYIHKASDEKQNSIFGVKRVPELSKYPITILFSGIHPINQLKMTIGKKIHELINSDDEYFQPKFKAYRDKVSQEIGIPLLPILPQLDEDLAEYRVRLVDVVDGRIISEFDVCDRVTKDTLDIYLQKLVYVYEVLAQDIRCKAE